MRNKESNIFLKHILESIERIEKFIGNLTKDKLKADELKQSAVIRQIEIIGEAVKNLPLDFVNKYPTVPWGEIARTRDKLIHHYFGIDLDTIWKVIKDDLPKLKKDIKKILEKETKNNGK